MTICHTLHDPEYVHIHVQICTLSTSFQHSGFISSPLHTASHLHSPYNDPRDSPLQLHKQSSLSGSSFSFLANFINHAHSQFPQIAPLSLALSVTTIDHHIVNCAHGCAVSVFITNHLSDTIANTSSFCNSKLWNSSLHRNELFPLTIELVHNATDLSHFTWLSFHATIELFHAIELFSHHTMVEKSLPALISLPDHHKITDPDQLSILFDIHHQITEFSHPNSFPYHAMIVFPDHAAILFLSHHKILDALLDVIVFDPSCESKKLSVSIRTHRIPLLFTLPENWLPPVWAKFTCWICWTALVKSHLIVTIGFAVAHSTIKDKEHKAKIPQIVNILTLEIFIRFLF